LASELRSGIGGPQGSPSVGQAPKPPNPLLEQLLTLGNRQWPWELHR
jgi:hypothetical protein